MKTLPIPFAKRVPTQKIASLGSLHAAIVGTTPGDSIADVFNVLLWDDSDRWAQWPLAGMSANSDDACCALLPGDILVTATKNGLSQVLVSEYRLMADPLAGAPTFIQAPPPYGDGQSRQTELVALPGGALVAVTQQQALPECDAIVRSPTGIWGSSQRIVIGTAQNDSFQMGACAAPWDGSLFVIDMVDGKQWGDAATFSYQDGGLVLAKAFPKVLTRDNPTDPLAVNGEDPRFVLVGDVAGKRVVVGYTNMTPDPDGSRQAHPVAAAITQDGTVTQAALSQDWVVSILNPIVPVVQASGLTLCYATGSPSANLLHCAAESIQLANGIFAFSTTKKDFVILNPDKTVSLVRFDATPIPPPMNPSVSFVTTGVRLAVFVQPPGAHVKWSSEVQGDLGSGPVLERELRAVEQTITASITLPDGSTAKATYKVTPGH